MHEQDVALIGRLIDGLGESEEILTVLVNRGTLPVTWRDIGSILQSLRIELTEIENEIVASLPMGASPS